MRGTVDADVFVSPCPELRIRILEARQENGGGAPGGQTCGLAALLQGRHRQGVVVVSSTAVSNGRGRCSLTGCRPCAFQSCPQYVQYEA